MRRASLRSAAAALAVAGAVAVGGDAYLAVKGAVARTLIARATDATLSDGGDHRPWPWADFRPLARLEVPRLGVRRPILSGAGGAVLAFGLGHVDGTAAPGGRGLSVVGGHRDGDARFLARLEVGDLVRVATPSGVSGWRVRQARVLQADAPVPDPGPGDRLWLVTCWPIDAVRPGNARYVVELRRRTDPAPVYSAGPLPREPPRRILAPRVRDRRHRLRRAQPGRGTARPRVAGDRAPSRELRPAVPRTVSM